MTENKWWMGHIGRCRELRELLYELITKCLNKSPGSNNFYRFGQEMPYSPFRNVFREKNTTKQVFTKTVISDFIYQCKLIDNKSSNVIRKAIDIVDNRFHELSKNEKLNFNTYANCDMIDERFDIMAGKGQFEEKCGACPAKWLYNTLAYIELNYESITNTSEVYKEYKKEEDKKVIDAIVESINECEKSFSEDKTDISQVGELWAKCMNCLPQMKDVEDLNMAYAKWYAARLSTWPILRASLKENYDERIVFKLLDSASMILYQMKVIKNDLWIQVEADRIISYMTLARLEPYYLKTLGKGASNEDYILRNLGELSPYNQLSLYLALWQLSIEERSAKTSEYQNEIDKLICNKDNELHKSILNLKFQILKFIYGYVAFEDTLNAIIEIDREDFSLEGNHDTFFALASLLTNILYQSTRAGILASKAFRNMNYKNLKKIKADSPGNYQRIFGDYTLLFDRYMMDKSWYEERLMEYLKEEK